ncbi:MAG: hypothetical protein KF832_19395 [Caldilineaceae bacterium]|nr:hypothetical protein [Caldilineaceae bacterium]
MKQMSHLLSQWRIRGKDVSTAVLTSTTLVFPFLILEAIFQPITLQSIPSLAILFALLWLLPLAFMLTLTPLVRTARAGAMLMTNPLPTLLKVAFLAILFLFWSSLLLDQLPCFLGVPNCD